MTEKEAIYILRNAAWLGSDADRQKVEEAVEVVAKAIEAQDMTLYMNLPEVSAEEVVEILKRNNRIGLFPSAQPERPKDIIQNFHDYQVEWLKSHCDIELEPELEMLIVRFLNDTANCYIMEIERQTG